MVHFSRIRFGYVCRLTTLQMRGDEVHTRQRVLLRALRTFISRFCTLNTSVVIFFILYLTSFVVFVSNSEFLFSFDSFSV